ncbi:MAG: acetylornithine transaminase [Micrococcales bacterium]|nr:acetylornithine transaminase [Micrococcales bacterium]
MTWQERYGAAMQQVFGTPVTELVSGSGSTVRDADGKEYLDLLGGIAVNCLGQGHPELVAAVTDQLHTLGHVSNFFTTEPQIALAEALRAHLPGARVFFGNSGTEVNEAALKLARKHRPGGGFVALEGGFHGRTMGALSITAKAAYREPFAPLLGPVTFVEPEDMTGLHDAITEETSAVILEVIQGERGVVPLSRDFVAAARKRSRETGTLLIIDEVQTGVGRTGDFFAHTRYGVEPDIVTLAKGLGGGIPIGAMLAAGAAADVLGAGDHGTTFGGNPVACRAALTVLQIIERDGLIDHVAHAGATWAREIEAIEGVREVRGAGYLMGISVEEAPAIYRDLLDEGFITNNPEPETIRIAPSYLLSEEERTAFTAALASVVARRRR